jgi:outer membrane protein
MLPKVFLRRSIRGGWLALLGVLAVANGRAAAETNGIAHINAPPSTNAIPWGNKELSLADCLNVALDHNSAILKSRADLEAAYGIMVQTRAIFIPKVRAKSSYQVLDQGAVEKLPIPAGLFDINYPDQQWSGNIQLVQSIYEGGRMTSAARTARLTKAQALLSHQAAVADALLEVRIGYYDVLLATQEIIVQEASVKLLTQELEDTRRRFDAGTVPRFNVLRAEVEVANARPKWIRARNHFRIGKNNLANLLGYNIPKEYTEDIPLKVAGELRAEPYDIALAAAVAKAMELRPELGALRKASLLREEGLINAKAGYKPSVQTFGGYGSRSPNYSDDLGRDISGWFVGAQMSWDIFDGLLTKGRVDEAKARLQKARLEVDDVGRRVELEVRTYYSYFIEAREVLESQKKVQEQAEEALRLATARAEAGTSTQLDVLNAQTALTEARTTQIQALRDYSVARARLERAIGQNLLQP